MTNQDLFYQITANLATYAHLQYVIKTELDRPAPHYMAGLWSESGELIRQRKELMAEYSQADMVIFKCPEHGLFFLTGKDIYHAAAYCEDDPLLPLERLLSDGTWQSEQERQQENLRQLDF